MKLTTLSYPLAKAQLGFPNFKKIFKLGLKLGKLGIVLYGENRVCSVCVVVSLSSSQSRAFRSRKRSELMNLSLKALVQSTITAMCHAR